MRQFERVGIDYSTQALRETHWPVWQRVVVLAVVIGVFVAVLRFLPIIVIMPFWFGLGLMTAMPYAANAAVSRGHRLRRLNDNRLLVILRAGGLRVIIWTVVGILSVAVLLVRLAAGGMAAWAGALAALLSVIICQRVATGMISYIYAPAHAGVILRRWTIICGAVVMLVFSALVTWWRGPTDLMTMRPVTSALFAEVFVLHQFWLGVEAFVLHDIAALAILPEWAEVVVAALLTGVSGAALAALVVAVMMPAKDWARAVAFSSDDAVSPPAQRVLLGIAGVVVVALAVLALWSEQRLSVSGPEAGPFSQFQDEAVEQIGTNFYPAGTYARIDAGRRALATADSNAQDEVERLVNAGFDGMLGGVDPFLDEYYSLRGEYWRVVVTLRGMLRGDAETAIESHLVDRLTAALDAEVHLAAVTERLEMFGKALAEAEAAQAVLEDNLLVASFVEGNPARLRIEGSFPALAPLPRIHSIGLFTDIETRLTGAGFVGVMGAVVAQRVLAVLVQRGIMRLGARALLSVVPIVGTLLAIGTDRAALALEEHFNRADFRAEIVAAIEEQRAAVLATLVVASQD